MLTTTHVALNGALTRWSQHERAPGVLRALVGEPATRRALLLGGVAPDVGLTLLTLGAAAWFPATRGWDLGRTFTHVYGTLFYADPTWIVAHNLLHAPLALAALGLAGHALRRDRRGRVLRAFAVGCLLHTALDVPTHVDDGPLLLFPLDWSLRFASPVSYWDPAHHGDVLGPLDTGLTVLLGGWLLVTWWRRRRAATATGVPGPGDGSPGGQA